MSDTVTIAREEYERLLEAAEDIEDEKTVAEFLAKPEEGVPSAFVDRMLEGESLVRLWREHRGHSQAELARRSGVNRVQLNDIEHGRKTGSVDTLKKLADALELTVDDLL